MLFPLYYYNLFTYYSGHKEEKRSLKDDIDVKVIGRLVNLMNAKDTEIKEKRSKLTPLKLGIKSLEGSQDVYTANFEKIQNPSESKTYTYTDTYIISNYQNRDPFMTSTTTEKGYPIAKELYNIIQRVEERLGKGDEKYRRDVKQEIIAKEAYKIIQRVKGRLEKEYGKYRRYVKLDNDIDKNKERNRDGRVKDGMKTAEKTKFEENDKDKEKVEANNGKNTEGRQDNQIIPKKEKYDKKTAEKTKYEENEDKKKEDRDNQIIPERTKHEGNENKQREGKQKHFQGGQQSENGKNKREKDLSETELEPDRDGPVDSPKIEEKVTKKGESFRNAPLTFNGTYNVNETLNGRPVVKVIDKIDK